MRFVFLIFAFLLTACGGGGEDSNSTTVAVYGDSLSSGFYAGGRLSPTPVQRLEEYGGGAFVVVDKSKSGMTAPELPVINGSENVVLLRLGYADAVLGVSEKDHAAAMQKAVDDVLAIGHVPVIVGLLQPPEEYETAARSLDRVQREISDKTGVAFIDVWSLGRVSLADQIHPDRSGSDKATLAIARQLVLILKGGKNE